MTHDEKERWFKQQYGHEADPSSERAARRYVLGLLLLGVVLGVLAALGVAYTFTR